MKLGELDPTRRRVGPLKATLAGVAVTGEDFSGAGECEISVNGSAWAAAGGSVVEVGDGFYYYLATAGEASTLGFVTVKLAGVCDEITFREDVEDAPQGIVYSETDPDRLHTGPLLALIAGAPVLGENFSGAGELQVSINGAAWQDAVGSVFEIGDGYYDYILDPTEITDVGWTAIKIAIVCDEYAIREDIVDDGTSYTVPPTVSILPSDGMQGGVGIFGDFRTYDAEQGELITTMLRFDEADDTDGNGVPARDSCRGLDDTYAPSGCTLPVKEIGAVGLAAVFDPASSYAYEAKDLITGGTLHTRDMTVKAILRFDYQEQDDYGEPGTIIARGLGTGASEYMPYAIEMEVVDVATREVTVRFLWHDPAGVLKTQTGANFIAPASGGYFQIVCTRRWISSTEVALRYYVNDRRVGEETSTDGEIGGGASGHTTIGARYTGADYERFFAGAIDEIAIANYEMSLEEIAATWLRISKYQPDGYRQMRDLMPPDLPISDDPDSRVQTDLRSMGLMLGFADARIENMRENMMPDRAYGRTLKAWERITEQPPGAGDSIDRRRARVVGHLSQRAGVSPPGVRRALEELLDCDGDDLEIIAFDNTIRDDFDEISDERWRDEAPGLAEWAALGGGEVQATAPADDYPWPLGFGALSLLTSIEYPRGNVNDEDSFSGHMMFCSVEPALLPANANAGIALYDWPSQSWLRVFRANTGGTFALRYEIYLDGALVSSGALHTAGIATSKYWIKITPTEDQTGVAAGAQKYDLSWSATSADPSTFSTTTVTARRRYGWAGFVVASTVAGVASPIDVTFGELALRNTKGTRPFYFYVYRDPGLGGSPDIAGANLVLRRMAHAFTHARVVESLSLLTDDPASLTDTGCMGGF